MITLPLKTRSRKERGIVKRGGVKGNLLNCLNGRYAGKSHRSEGIMRLVHFKKGEGRKLHS